MTVRSKFRCQKILEQEGATRTFSATFIPVTSGSEENKKFWEWTPCGELRLDGLKSRYNWEVGKEYFIDVTLAVPMEA